jgi:hypothetical protein
MRTAIVVALMLSSPLWACSPGKKRNVRLSVVVILASETDTKVDKKLEAIATEVRKTYPMLKGFRLVKMECKSLEVGKADEFALLEGETTTINIKGAADKMDVVRLEVGPPSMGKVTYATPCGKFLPIVTPIVTKKGETLLIAIRVQPCTGK